MHQIATIPYLETDGFISIFDSSTNTIYACPKSICEIFGVDWRSQRAKLSDNATRWQFRIIMLKLPGDDRKRKHGVIPDKKVRSWVCSINPEKVRQDIREQLIAFQDECDSILVDYWTKGIAINPRHDLQADDSLKHFIAETIGTSIKDAMCQLANALRETFVSKDTFHDFTDKYERRLTALEQNRGKLQS